MKVATSLTVGAFALCAAVVTPLSAQSWTAVGSPNNVSAGQQFWDNASNDGSQCNAGYVVTAVAGNSCANQRPASWLPYNGPTPSYYLNSASGGAQGFLFGAGTYGFSLLSGDSPGGDIAGANTDWGYFDGAHVRHTLSGGPLPASLAIVGSWGLWIQLTNGNFAYSDLDPQFALFGFNNTTPFSNGAVSLLTPTTGSFIAGIEDILISGSDRDYQDAMFQFFVVDEPDVPTETVPEPGTMLLLGTGLAGLYGKARRRRQVG